METQEETQVQPTKKISIEDIEKRTIIILNDIFNENNTSIQEYKGNHYERDILIAPALYEKIINNHLDLLKTFINSSELNCVHKNALEKQKWPLLNLTRQLLRCFHLTLEPKRICNGYKEGKKQFKRMFIIEEID